MTGACAPRPAPTEGTFMTTSPITARLTPEQIADIELDRGNHAYPGQGHCLLEVVSLFAGEPFSDHPQCVDPVLAAFGRHWNDDLPNNEARAQLKRYIPLLPRTKRGEALSMQRSWMAFDWLVRTYLPAWLDLVPALSKHAAELRALDPITGRPEFDRALPALERAKTAATDALDAARAAAGDAALYAAGDAALDAARAAALYAAGDAAGYAALYAALYAAVDAAGAAAVDAVVAAAVDASPGGEYAAARLAADRGLAPVTLKLQASAHDLYMAMINAEPSDAFEEAGP